MAGKARPSPVDQRIDRAEAALKAGEPAEARRLAAQALALKADGPVALFRLSVILLATGPEDQAAAVLRRLVTLAPDQPWAYVRLGLLWEQQGARGEALALYQAAQARGLADPELDCALGNARRSSGDLDGAVTAYRQALGRRPDFLPALINLGHLFLAKGDVEPAIASYQAALARRPDPLVASNLAAALIEDDQPAAAVELCREHLKTAPDHRGLRHHLAVALTDLQHYDDATAIFRALLAEDPAERAEICCNLGTALLHQNQLDAAIEAFRAAVAARPGAPEPLLNLGNALRFIGCLDQAVPVLAQAVAAAPDNPRAHAQYAMALLHAGDYPQGWREYEWRWQASRHRTRPIDPYQPQWAGEPLAGQSLLFYAEQGFGDVLQFVRFAPVLAARGARVIVAVNRPLIRLIAPMTGVAECHDIAGPLPAADFYLPMMSAPHALGLTLDDIPGDLPYLTAPPAAADWRARLAALPGRKVGLVWSGSPRRHDRGANLIDQRRSVSLDRFAPFGSVPGLSFLSLQKGDLADQALAPPAGLTVTDWMDEIGDFADTAALVAGLDLVITVDTSVAHLAGALKVPVWVLSRHDACWRWLSERDDSPWYPGILRLFRQPAPGDWDSVITAATRALGAWAGGAGRS